MLKDITKTQKEYFLETGITLYQLQTFERMLKVLLTLVNPINDPSNTSDQCKDYQFLEKKTLGFILKKYKDRLVLNGFSDEIFDDFIEKRNIFIHCLSSIDQFDINTINGIKVGFKFLDEFNKIIEQISNIFRPISLAVLRIMVESKNCTSINSAIYDDINSLLSKQEYSISLKEFSNYDEFYEDIIKEINIPKDKKELWKKTKIINLLRSASEQCQKNSGWASLADCGTWIKNNYPGTIHNHYGYEKLSQLIKDSHLFQIKKQYHKGSGACSLYIKYTG